MPIDSVRVALPQNPEAERTVLGSILIDEEAYRRVGNLEAKDFYDTRHPPIWIAIKGLIEGQKAVDLLTVKDELVRLHFIEKAGGVSYLSSLVDGIPDIANIERYAGIVREKALLRRALVSGNSVGVIEELIKENVELRMYHNAYVDSSNESAQMIGEMIRELREEINGLRAEISSLTEEGRL